MRWKAFFFLRPETIGANKNTYGFNSLSSPPNVPELRFFEDKLIDMIQNLEFKDSKATPGFQNKLLKIVNEIDGG